MIKILFAVILIAVAFVPAPAWAQSGVNQQFEGFNLQGYTDGGDKAWDLKGDTANVMQDTIEITNVDANQYGESDVNIKANTGVVNKASGNIQLKKNVVITSESGSRLTTDSLDWQKDKDLVATEDHVKITDKSMTASGSGLQAQPGLKTAKLDKDVTVEVSPEPGNPKSDTVTITCEGSLEIDQKVNIAVFHDKVVAVQTDRTLKADKMDVYFNPQAKKIDKVVCIGNVVILQGGNITYADKAVYNAQEQKFILTGRPKLILETGKGEGISGFPK